MREDWQTKKLGDLCEVFADGDWIESKDQSLEGIRLIQTGNVGEGVFKERAEKARHISETTFKRLRCTEIFEGDCLISRLPDPVGRSCILPETGERMITAVDCTIVRFKAKELLPAFFNYYSRSEDYLNAVSKECTGTTRNRISRSNLSLTPIPVPPLPEQQRIVLVLDEAFEGIAAAKASAEKNLKNARALFEAYLREVFSKFWKTNNLVTLADLATEITDGDHAPPPKALIGVPFITIGNIVKDANTIDFTDTFMVPRKYFDGLRPNKKPRKGDVLYTVTGSYGIPVLVAETQDFCFQRHIGLIRPKPDVTSEWLFYLLMSPQIVEQANDGATGTAQRTVSLKVLRGFAVPQIPLATQQAIAVKLKVAREETRRLESIYVRKLAALQELKQSLLQQAFSGELTKHSRQSVVVPFPTTIPSITTTDLHAGILATAYDLHEKSNLQKYFGHVKAEKIAHMVEAHLGIDLARTPIKDAAGPNDYTHLLKVEHRARKAGYFNFERTASGGYRVKKLKQFDKLLARTCEGLGERKHGVDELLELMLPMTTQQAEIFATVYAAWNNLLLDGQKPSDEDIVFEARENWHSAKLNIPREKFFAAIEWLREKGVVASGRGNKVSAKSGKK